jgi:hypothetical protein
MFDVPLMPHLAGVFVLIEAFGVSQCAAQELPGRFETRNLTQLLSRTEIDNPKRPGYS